MLSEEFLVKSAFHFIPKLFSGVEFRSLYKPLDFFCNNLGFIWLALCTGGLLCWQRSLNSFVLVKGNCVGQNSTCNFLYISYTISILNDFIAEIKLSVLRWFLWFVSKVCQKLHCCISLFLNNSWKLYDVWLCEILLWFLKILLCKSVYCSENNKWQELSKTLRTFLASYELNAGKEIRIFCTHSYLSCLSSLQLFFNFTTPDSCTKCWCTVSIQSFLHICCLHASCPLTCKTNCS